MITDLGMLEPDPDTAELVLTALHQGITVEQVRAETGWALRSPTTSSSPSRRARPSWTRCARCAPWARTDDPDERILHHVDEGPRDAPVLVLSGSLGSTVEMWRPQFPP